MTTRTFLMIAAAIGIFYGVGFLFVPEMIARLYGSLVTPPVVLAYRYFGVALLGAGLLCAAVRDLRDATILRGVMVALAISNFTGILVSAWGTMNGTINSLGWMNVALYSALTLGSLYFYRILSTSARALPA